MKQILFLFFVLPCLALAGCNDDDEESPLNFEVPELTPANTISFDFISTDSEYAVCDVAGSQVAIVWGDGSKNGYKTNTDGQVDYNDLSNSVEPSHKFAKAGTYHIQIWADNLTYFRIPVDIYQRNEIKNLQIGKCPMLAQLELYGLRGVNELTPDDCPQLKTIVLSGNEDLTSLDLNRCTALENLQCSQLPKLASIDLTANKKLKYIDLKETPQAIIKVADDNRISYVGLIKNGLASIDLTRFPFLTVLNCSYNSLTGIDASSSPFLEELYVENNNLTSIKLPANTRVDKLFCNNNKLDAESLNQLFDSLLPANGTNLINFVNNPGAGSCDVSVMKGKGWVIGGDSDY